MPWYIGTREHDGQWELYATNSDHTRDIILERSTSNYVIKRELDSLVVQERMPLPHGVQIGSHNVQSDNFSR